MIATRHINMNDCITFEKVNINHTYLIIPILMI